MKIGIVTFHFVNNFGGALQAYALQKTIEEKCDCDTEIINYRNWFIRLTDYIRIFPITTKLDEMMQGFLTIGLRKRRIKKFKMFMQDNCNLSREYLSNASLIKNSPCCDKYICGSDQIWNPVLTGGVAKPYFLEFEKDKKKKIAYAPSMGTQKIPLFWLQKMSKYIKNIEYVSIRESSSIQTVEEIVGHEVERFIDPTFLLEEGQWKNIAKCPVNISKYILVYMMQKDNEVYEHVLWMKRKWKLPVVDISRYGYKPDFVDQSLVDIGPDEFIGLFQNAQYVCTNSYHGLVFSIIFRKKICLIPSKRFGDRISNLLQVLELEHKEKQNDMESYMLEYNTEHVQKVIDREKEKALKYLCKCLKETK